jgi:hypothetical protein
MRMLIRGVLPLGEGIILTRAAPIGRLGLYG